jgi:hypothetical protein
MQEPFFGALDRHRPQIAIKLGSWRLAGMVLAFLMYAAFVVYILYLLVTQGPSVFA